MTLKKKFFIAVFTVCVVLAIVVLDAVVTTVKNTPATPISQAEAADISIAQYTERVNGGARQVQGSANILSTVLFPDSEPLPDGCVLRFSLVPNTKAVDPNSQIVYTITLSNGGKDVCRNVSLSMFYTDKEHYVSSDPAPSSSDYYWEIGNLNSKQSKTISLTTKNTGTDGTQLISEGCATGDNTSDVCAQTVIFIQSGASRSAPLSEKTAILHIKNVLGTVWGKLFSHKEFGIWVWDSPASITSAYGEQIISTAKQNGFNAIYITIDDYLDNVSQNGNVDETKRKAYLEALHTFISAANTSGIEVDVVGGAKDWALEKNRWKGYALIDFVNLYNNTYPKEHIRNLQYDVEPYLLSDYETNKEVRLQEFVAFIDESAARMKNVPAGLSVVIPHFYDKDVSWTPTYTYKDQKAYTFTHLLRVLSQKDNTTLIIMAYRNFFDKDNGVRSISEPELEEASRGTSTTKIIIAQEAGDVPPAYVTFHDLTKHDLLDALTKIQNSYTNYKSFNGVAVHYFDAFVKLNDETAPPTSVHTIIRTIIERAKGTPATTTPSTPVVSTSTPSTPTKPATTTPSTSTPPISTSTPQKHRRSGNH